MMIIIIIIKQKIKRKERKNPSRYCRPSEGGGQMVTSAVAVVVMGVLDPIKRKKSFKLKLGDSQGCTLHRYWEEKKASIFLLRPFPDRCDQWM